MASTGTLRFVLNTPSGQYYIYVLDITDDATQSRPAQRDGNRRATSPPRRAGIQVRSGGDGYYDGFDLFHAPISVYVVFS